MEDFPTLGLEKKAYRKIYMRKTGQLQEAYRRRPRAVLSVLKV